MRLPDGWAARREALARWWRDARSCARARLSGERVRVPTILQMEALECGAASLGMVLAHHGRYVALEELREACGVSRDGSKASNILKAARAYGMVAKGFRKEPRQLAGLPMPVILHWNFNHFVVLEGVCGDRAYLNDPAQGPARVTRAELDQAFTGVALTFEPGPAFEGGGKKPSLLRSLAPRLRGTRKGLAYVVLAGLALVVPGLVVPAFSKVFVDAVLVRGLTDWLRPLLIVMGVTAVLQLVLTALRQQSLLRLETKLAVGTSSRFFWHVLRLPIPFFDQRYAGEIGNRVAINDRVASLLSGELATTVINGIVIVFYAAIMIQYDVVLTLVGVAVAALNVVALKWVSRRRVDLNQRLLQDRGKLMGVSMGGLQTIETLKATGSESDFFSRWSGHQAKVLNATQKLALATHLLAGVPPFLMAVNTALILGIGGHRVMEGHLSMGMLVAYQALMLAFVSPVNRMVNLGGTLQEAKGDMNRLDDVVRAEEDPGLLAAEAAEHDAEEDPLAEDGPPGEGDDARGPEADRGPGSGPPRSDGGPRSGVDVALAGSVELREVSFGYSRLEPPLIRGLDLVMTPGSRVALVGGSGCGKSTVAKLVAGLYEPWEGEILFDGRPRTEIPRRVLNCSLAFVDQEIFLFEGTIRENLTLWETGIATSDLVRAARDAHVHEEIVGRPGGYDSFVEEGGRNLSGGQRQRLEICRALVGDPSVLVLDEATSALDPVTEKIVDDNLRRRGISCLIVAHRLSTIRDCDEIIVLEAGRVAQRGTHRELSGVPGPYHDLVASGAGRRDSDGRGTGRAAASRRATGAVGVATATPGDGRGP